MISPLLARVGIAGSIILLAVYVIRWLLRRPPRYRKQVRDDLSKFFEVILSDGGFLVIEAPNKKRFIQFRKSEGSRSDGIQLGFPRAPWSEEYYDMLQKTLDDRGIDYEIQATGQETVPAFLTVHLKRDLVKAEALAKLILLEVFKLEPHDRIKLYVSG